MDRSADGRKSARLPHATGFRWLFLLTALIVVLGVLLQAFSIAAYARGAGAGALDMHVTVGAVIHSIEIVVFLAALVGYWGTWRQVGVVLLLPVIGTVQVFLIGDTDKSGSWINGLHGLFALIVLMLAVALVQDGMRSLRHSTALCSPFTTRGALFRPATKGGVRPANRPAVTAAPPRASWPFGEAAMLVASPALEGLTVSTLMVSVHDRR